LADVNDDTVSLRHNDHRITVSGVLQQLRAAKIS
jgi:hypothetical protein